MARWSPNLFLREGHSKGYAEDYLQSLVATGHRIATAGVPVVFSLAHLANLSRTLYSDLHEIVSRKHSTLPNFPYRNFTIRKRTGGVRWISVPVPPLMAVQSWINQNILNAVSPHIASFAYAVDRRVKDHATLHCGADWLVKVDIKDFFSNISERQVFDVFKALGYPNLLSFEMARLCTRVTPRRKGSRWVAMGREYEIGDYYSRYVGSLPQGAPTSPALSNLACRSMDDDLASLAQHHGAVYSRYADDLCFSVVGGNRAAAVSIKKSVSEVLWRHSFSENPRKTRIIPPGCRKTLTGLIVNGDKPTVPREVRDLVRMHLHFCKTKGVAQHCQARKFRSVIGFRNHLYGLIMYINSIDPTHGARLPNHFGALPWLDFDL